MTHFSKVYSAELDGIEARLIEVETDIHVGLHAFNIVGLADKALTEARERVSSALKNIGIKPPSQENRKIVVNMAPADVKKTGSHYDLAIAVGYLLATEQIKTFDAKDKIFVGELSLEGKLRPITGALNMARLAKKAGFEFLIVPKGNAEEAAIVGGLTIIPIKDMGELIAHLEDRAPITAQPQTQFANAEILHAVDISEIKGQPAAKRALTIAAAGGHNMLMAGSPGAGKTMLAQALSSILPPMSLEEGIEVTQIYSAANLLSDKPFINTRPFRAPHHTASPIAVIGGGSNPRPGEVSLAHRGVLFLDELPEFRRDLLETLRQPIEAGKVHISRIRGSIIFPAKFMLIAAMNPCPCGYYRDPEKECKCGAHEIARYQKKISGPLLDRIDLQIDVPRVPIEELRAKKTVAAAEVAAIREAVAKARGTQSARFAGLKIFTNGEMSSKQCEALAKLTDAGEKFLETYAKKHYLSARGYYRVIKVGRTIADIEGAESVTENHLAEAVSYRVREER